MKTMSKHNPEAIFIHLGQGDIWKKLEPENIAGYAKQMMWKLLSDTEASICYSLLIPVNDSAHHQAAVKVINDSISSFVTEIRKNSSFRDRIFTSNNNVLSGHLQFSTGPHGKKVDLTERGQAKFWLMMRDSLRRTLKLTNNQDRKRTTTKTSRNQVHHE